MISLDDTGLIAVGVIALAFVAVAVGVTALVIAILRRIRKD